MKTPPFTDQNACHQKKEETDDVVQEVKKDFMLGTQIWLDLGTLTRSGWKSAGIINSEPLRKSCREWMKDTANKLSACTKPTNFNAKDRFALEHLRRILTSDFSLHDGPDVLKAIFSDEPDKASDIIRSILKKIFGKMTEKSIENHDLLAFSLAAHGEFCNETVVPYFIIKKTLIEKNNLDFLEKAVSACMDRELRGIDTLAIRVLFHRVKILEFVKRENADPLQYGKNEIQIGPLTTIIDELMKSCTPAFNNDLWLNARQAIVANEGFLYWVLDRFNGACPDIQIERDSISDELNSIIMSQSSDPWIQLTGRMLQAVGNINIKAGDSARRIARTANQEQKMSRKFHLQSWLEDENSLIWKKVLSDELIPWAMDDHKRILRALILGAAAVRGHTEVIDQICNVSPRLKDELRMFVDAEYNKFITTAPCGKEEDVLEANKVESLAIAILVWKDFSNAYEKEWRADIDEIQLDRTLHYKLADAYWKIRRESFQISHPYAWSTPFFQSVMIRKPEDDLLLAALKGLGVEIPNNVVTSIGEANHKSLKELLKGVRNHSTYRQSSENRTIPTDLNDLFKINEVQQLVPNAPIQHLNRAVTAICVIVSRSSLRDDKRKAHDYFIKCHYQIIEHGFSTLACDGITKYRREIDAIFKLRLKAIAKRLVSGKPFGAEEKFLLINEVEPFRSYVHAIQGLASVTQSGKDYRLIPHLKSFILASVILLASITLLVVNRYG